MLDQVQQQLDQLGALIEASAADPESVGGPEAPADAHNLTDWRLESCTGRRFRRFDLGTAVLAAEHGLDIEVSIHGEQFEDGTIDRWVSASQECGDIAGMNAPDARKLARLLMQAANKVDFRARRADEPHRPHNGQCRGFRHVARPRRPAHTQANRMARRRRAVPADALRRRRRCRVIDYARCNAAQVRYADVPLPAGRTADSHAWEEQTEDEWARYVFGPDHGTDSVTAHIGAQQRPDGGLYDPIVAIRGDKDKHPLFLSSADECRSAAAALLACADELDALKLG